ncbi:MAG: ABC transporter ATP-binding protein [Alphaproteobacteria bacterium]|nr:ABC transporter ATP-binding protein [Alphaproteobacteria bacterium]
MEDDFDQDVLLDVRRLSVTFAGGVRALRGVSFQVRAGEVVALVGESGSGKSTSGLAVMGLIERDRGAEVSGEIRLRGKDGDEKEITGLSERELRALRGNDVAMIFQEPMSSLNPIYAIGSQICEAIRIHRSVSRAEAARDAREALDLLGIPNPDRCMVSYPHQLSGGMRQRVMIAMALACRPRMLIADEPTTALDVTIQAQIIAHLKRLQRQTGMAILFITHNLGLVAEIADRAMVMYAGEIVESGPVADIFGAPRMPYTRALLQSLPRLGVTRASGTRIEAIPGNVPSSARWPSGCAFHPRCRYVVAGRCDASEPMLEACDTGRHRVRCLRWRELEKVAS